MSYTIKILLLVSFFTSIYASEYISAPDGYTFEAELSQKSIFLGEATELKLIYRYKDVEDYEIIEPDFDGIVVKELSSKDYEDENNLFTEEILYSLKPQREGNFSLSNITVNTQIIDSKYKNFNNRSKYTKKFSLRAQTLMLEVKKLPNNITAIGKYQLSADVDKKSINPGEPITLTFSLKGDGNIQNLDALDLSIKNASLFLRYTTKSKRAHLQTKVYEIISNESYTIPSFELPYYDKELAILQKSRTEPIHITLNSDKEIPNYIYLFILTSFLVMLISIYKVKKTKKCSREAEFISSIKSSSTKNELYKKVVVFLGKDKELDSLIYQLEDERKLNFKLIKKEILKLVKLRLNERNNLFFTAKNTL